MVAKRGHDPALGVLHGCFGLRFVLWGPRPGRKHGGPVVGGELLVLGVQSRLVAAGPVHRRLCTAAFSLSGITSSGTPPQNSNIRTCDVVQSARARLHVRSTKV